MQLEAILPVLGAGAAGFGIAYAFGRLKERALHAERTAEAQALKEQLRKDGEEEKERFLDQMYKLENAEKSNFDYVVYDSDPERQFAELLDGREDIKLFMKLPDKFKIDTPVGP